MPPPPNIIFSVMLYILDFEIKIIFFSIILFFIFLNTIFLLILFCDKKIKKFFLKKYKISPNTVDNIINITEISKAVKYLSNNKVGSIIIINANNSLLKYFDVDSATKVDSLINKKILISLFLKTSPLHDGAVIISNNRLKYCNVFLPVYIQKSDIIEINSFIKNKNIELGSRIRVAYQISKLSNSLIIITRETDKKVYLFKNKNINIIEDENILFNEINKWNNKKDF